MSFKQTNYTDINFVNSVYEKILGLQTNCKNRIDMSNIPNVGKNPEHIMEDMRRFICFILNPTPKTFATHKIYKKYIIIKSIFYIVLMHMLRRRMIRESCNSARKVYK